MKLAWIFALITVANCMNRERTIETKCEDCRDDDELCRSPRIKGLCQGNIFSNVVKDMCKLTCEVCAPCESVTCTEETDPCRDHHDVCPVIAEEKHCTNDRFRNFAQVNCRKSCGLCQPCHSTISARSLSTEECLECKDARPAECSYWANQVNYCTSPVHQHWMATHCPRSCRVCKPCGGQRQSSNILVPTTSNGNRPKPTTFTRTTTTKFSPTTTRRSPVVRDDCEADCDDGSCYGDDRSSICECNKPSSRLEVPYCSGSCGIICPRPDDFKGDWLETCSGKRFCTCTQGSVADDVLPGAFCPEL